MNSAFPKNQQYQMQPKFINHTNHNSYHSTNESYDFDENEGKFLTPKQISNNERNWVYQQKKLNFNNPFVYHSNNNFTEEVYGF